jgi:hypothetical protein
MSPPTLTEKQTEALRTIWGQYRAMAKTSRRLKAVRGGGQKVLLYGSIGAVIATPFAKTLKTLHWDTLSNGLVVAGTLLFVLVAWFNKEVVGDDSQKPWVRARPARAGRRVRRTA